MIKVSVPGKVILAGEHAVVDGYPALVAAVDLRLRVEVEEIESDGVEIVDKYKDVGLARKVIEKCLEKRASIKGFAVRVKIESELPIGGLGSSAALATGLVWGLLPKFSQEEKDEVVAWSEMIQHGRASGVDQAVVREGGVLRFVKGEGIEKVNTEIEEEFMLIDSGQPIESTKEMIEKVSKGNYVSEFNKMSEIAGDWKVAKIKENQRLLEKIGVVGELAKNIVKEVERVGGVAKVCGGGGVKEGSGIVLAYSRNNQRLIQLAERNNWTYFLTKLGAGGVRYE